MLHSARPPPHLDPPRGPPVLVAERPHVAPPALAMPTSSPPMLTEAVVKHPVSDENSLSALQQLMLAAVSCITYVRGLLPEDQYKSRAIGTMSLKFLRRGMSETTDRLLNTFEHGVFDALQRRYLRTVTVAIIPRRDEPHRILECYRFSIDYPSDDARVTAEIFTQDRADPRELARVQCVTLADVARQTLRMMRALVMMLQSLTDLPAQCFLDVHLEYFDDVTPPDYEPPYFRPADFVPQLVTPARVHCHLGSIHTPHHRLALDVESTRDQDTSDSGLAPVPAVTSSSIPAISQPPTQPQPQQILPPSLPLPTATGPTATGTTTSTDHVDCVCGHNENDNGMVQCEGCKSWSHVVCWGYFHGNDPRCLNADFACHRCRVDVSPGMYDKLRDLALVRTAISVTWNEIPAVEASGDEEGGGGGSQTDAHVWKDGQLASRLSIPLDRARGLLTRLVAEHIGRWTTGLATVAVAKRASRRTKFEVRVDKHEPLAKSAVRFYFDPTLRELPPLPALSTTSSSQSSSQASSSSSSEAAAHPPPRPPSDPVPGTAVAAEPTPTATPASDSSADEWLPNTQPPLTQSGYPGATASASSPGPAPTPLAADAPAPTSYSSPGAASEAASKYSWSQLTGIAPTPLEPTSRPSTSRQPFEPPAPPSPTLSALFAGSAASQSLMYKLEQAQSMTQTQYPSQPSQESTQSTQPIVYRKPTPSQRSRKRALVVDDSDSQEALASQPPAAAAAVASRGGAGGGRGRGVGKRARYMSATDAPLSLV
ncbi:hypothetical protein H9P43_005000 [Blastocladiella emersonii ATCC 22665]|nr:hypothetical protein H9P43_005000 [Blastocladiella emersonii ATCC 22665]